MKPLKQSELIGRLEASIEAAMQVAVAVFQNLEEEALLRPAANGGWSIVQCLAHLNSYGDYYLPRIGQALERVKDTPATGRFKSGWLGAYFTRMMSPQGTTTYRASKKHLPPPAPDAYATVAAFIGQQEQLLAYLRRAADVSLSAVRIPISVAPFIRLKMGDILQFLIAHQERHLLQAQRNL